MEIQKKIDKLKQYILKDNTFSVYDYDDVTLNELLSKFFTKINGCVDVTNATIELSEYLVNIGIPQEISDTFIEKLNDGTFENLVNKPLYNDLSNDISELKNNKADKNTIWTMANMGQDVKEAMTDGAVAVVGRNAVLNENIVNYQVTPIKTNFIEYGKNNFNKDNVTKGYINVNGSISNNEQYLTTDFIYVEKGITYTCSPSIRKLLLFNLDYTPITESFIDPSGTTIQEYTFTPTQNGYVRVTFLVGHINKFQIEKGEYATEYEEYNISLKNGKPLGKNSIDTKMILDKAITVNKTNFIKPSKNLINLKLCVEGYISATGNINAVDDISRSYLTTDFIEVEPNEYYSISKARKILMFDINKKPLISSYVDEWVENYVFVTSENVAYIRLSTKKEYDIQLEKGNNSTDFESYKAVLDESVVPSDSVISLNHLDSNLKAILLNGENKLDKKIILNFGDSIAAGDGNNGVGYAELIAQQYNAKCDDYAIGGYTITNGEKGIINQVNRAINNNAKCDYILFNGGTNDINGGNVVSLGSITTGYDDEFDTSTFCGSFENICKTLKNTWVDSKILYVRVHNMASRGLNNQIEFGNKAIEICNKWSIPYVDLFNEGGLNTHLPAMRDKYTKDTYVSGVGDKTHPNELGYITWYVNPIYNKMKSL